MTFEILTLPNGEDPKFRAAFDFENPKDLLTLGVKNLKLSVSQKSICAILKLPLDRVKEWFEIIDTPPVIFANFWYFCQRFGGGVYEHGDPQSYEKAKLILQELKKQKVKIVDLPNLQYASYDKNKIQLIQEALVLLEAPIHQIPPVGQFKHRPPEVIVFWNTWLDEKRDPKNVTTGWGDLRPVDEEEDKSEPIKEAPVIPPPSTKRIVRKK